MEASCSPGRLRAAPLGTRGRQGGRRTGRAMRVPNRGGTFGRAAVRAPVQPPRLRTKHEARPGRVALRLRLSGGSRQAGLRLSTSITIIPSKGADGPAPCPAARPRHGRADPSSGRDLGRRADPDADASRADRHGHAGPSSGRADARRGHQGHASRGPDAAAAASPSGTRDSRHRP